MQVLGLGGSNHDFSACLVRNSEVVVAIEEERLTRVKHCRGMAPLSIGRCEAANYCLDAGRTSLDAIDVIVGSDNLSEHYYARFSEKMTFINHHLAHAASAYYVSGFDECTVVVVDGYGSRHPSDIESYETITIFFGKKGVLSKSQATHGRFHGAHGYEGERWVENSLGLFYSIITRAIGFAFLQEGKTMGLAPHGTDRYVDQIERFITYSPHNGFECSFLALQGIADYVEAQISQARTEPEAFQVRADMAYAAQSILENTLASICGDAMRKHGTRKLCLAGGVALNGVANVKLLKRLNPEDLFIQPASGDAGLAIGAAIYASNGAAQPTAHDSNATPFSPYLGREYSIEEIARELNSHSSRLDIFQVPDPAAAAAKLIYEGNIIGFFSGRSEIGPRALGNRSILADARCPKMKDAINSRIKHREAFRPFAPMVLHEKAREIFDLRVSSDYMLLVPHVWPKMRAVVPAITHIDGTGRVQTVKKELNHTAHRLLTEFDRLSGVPVILNTSFNNNGEPIVESPIDAIRCFLNIDLDATVIGPFVITKRR